jgi:hypothetical protein
VALISQTVVDHGVIRERAPFLGEVLVHYRVGEVGAHERYARKRLKYRRS